MSNLSSLKARLGPPVRGRVAPQVSSGFPARYHLSADGTFVKSISAIEELWRRHMPLVEAKRAVERLLIGEPAIVELPMLENATVFETQMQALGVKAVKEPAAAAAVEG